MRRDQVTSKHKWLQLPDELTARYNCFDTVATAQLYHSMRQELRATRQDTFWRERFWPLVPVLMDMQRRGIGDLDKEVRNALRRDYRKQVTAVEDTLWQAVKGSQFERQTFFDSPKQLGAWLYDELGLPAPPKVKDRPARSTSQPALVWVLNNLLRRHDSATPLLHDLFHRSRLQTVLERYLIIEGDTDGRVRPTIKASGAETMRIAYAGGPGEAVQQWPAEVRSMVRAAPGKVFIARDYSQLEARILAYLSGDHVSIATFENGGDIHTQNALDLFGYTADSWESLDAVTRMALRNAAKTFLYGLSYGGNPETLNQKLFCPCYRCAAKAPPVANIPRAQMAAAADRWSALHQPVLRFREALLRDVKGSKGDSSYTSPWGCRRFFFEPYKKAARSLYNYPMQHGASQIINDAMLKLAAKGAPLTLQMHDELVMEVPENQVDQWDNELREAMEAPVTQLGGVVFPTSFHQGQTWGDLK